MSEIPAPNRPKLQPVGYLPLPSVFCALDYVLTVWLESREASLAPRPHGANATDFLMTWLQLGAMPSSDQLGQAKASMHQQIDALAAALTETLRSFVDDLGSHPAPLPGSPFGDYFHDLVDLSAQGTGRD